MRPLVVLFLFGSLHAARLGAQPAPEREGPRLEVGGYASFRYEASDAVEGSITLRRLGLTTGARWGERLRAYSEVVYERLASIRIERDASATEDGLTLEEEVEGANEGGIRLAEAWGQLELGPVGARFGAILVPVGRLNLAHHDHLWSFPRRPLVDRGAGVLPVAATWTEMGLGLVGEHGIGAGGAFSWQAYLVNGATLDFAFRQTLSTGSLGPGRLSVRAEVRPTQGAFDGSNPADAVAGRVALRPGPAWEVALSGYTGAYTPDFLDEDARLTTVGLDGDARLGPVIAQAEALYTRYADVERVLTDLARVAADGSATSGDDTVLETEVEITATGLADSRGGFWLDLSWPIALAPGTLGFDAAVLAPVARYERVWLGRALGDFVFTAGRISRLVQSDQEQIRFAAGLAFRPLPEAVVQLVYERNQAVVGPLIDPESGAETTDGFVLGLAFGF